MGTSEEATGGRRSGVGGKQAAQDGGGLPCLRGLVLPPVCRSRGQVGCGEGPEE